jgi:hypothetical protein
MGDSMKMAHNPFKEFSKIPQHKLHGDRITQKWVILCCGTKGLRQSLEPETNFLIVVEKYYSD